MATLLTHALPPSPPTHTALLLCAVSDNPHAVSVTFSSPLSTWKGSELYVHRHRERETTQYCTAVFSNTPSIDVCYHTTSNTSTHAGRVGNPMKTFDDLVSAIRHTVLPLGHKTDNITLPLA